MLLLITQSLIILLVIGMVFFIISGMFHWKINLIRMLLLLLWNFVSSFGQELMYLTLVESISSNLINLYGFDVLVIYLFSFIFIFQTNLRG